jgi:hypothetical protein
MVEHMLLEILFGHKADKFVQTPRGAAGERPLMLCHVLITLSTLIKAFVKRLAIHSITFEVIRAVMLYDQFPFIFHHGGGLAYTFKDTADL